jgi:hypothetical protein
MLLVRGWGRIWWRRRRWVDDKYDLGNFVIAWRNPPAVQLVIKTVHHGDKVCSHHCKKQTLKY